MDLRRYSKPLSLPLVLVLLVVLAAGAVIAAPGAYVHEDARVSGQEIHTFVDGQDNVTVVVGNFRLKLGGRIISGRDAVIWVKSTNIGRFGRNAMTLFVQGDATIREPDSSTTTDRIALIKLHHQGRLSASGRMSRHLTKDFPLYQTALAYRKADSVRAKATTRPSDAIGPPLIRGDKGEVTPPPPKDKTPVIYQPVSMRADGFTSHEMGKDTPQHRRVTIARGNVYLSQGHPDSDEFLELRSQSAVVFSTPGKQGSTGPLGGVAGSREAIRGVYLEGDVVISRGERFFRGPMAYYDFVTNRSLMPNAVFRTIQKQRNIPIYIRAAEARTLSDREMWFKNARVSSSDFYSPTYHIGASRAYVRDVTIYEDKIDPKTGRRVRGDRLSEQSFLATMEHSTFNFRSLPVMYWPWTRNTVTDGNSPLRTIQVGSDPDLGTGVNTKWHLFRLLGLVRPEGFDGRANLGVYDKGITGGADIEYLRESFSGYIDAHGVTNQEGKDDFGDVRKNVEASQNRSRLTWRHKQFLGDDWQVQGEFSYISDRTYLEKFFPSEFHSGKDQETLVYAKKQRDNWVFDTLLQGRVNSFYTRTESLPDLGLFVIGQKLGDMPLVWFSEQHAGVKRWRPDTAIADTTQGSTSLARLDTRQEVNLPVHVGPINFLPYATGRFTAWSESRAPDGDKTRPYGQVGVRASTRIWRVYENVKSRLWDLRGLRHVLTPEATVFLADAHGIDPAGLWPLDEGIEPNISSLSGFSAGLTQRLQTRRGRPGKRRIVDWMRFKVEAGAFSNSESTMPADGRVFGYMPEYSLGRNFVNADYEWDIAEGTMFNLSGNYDVDSGRLGRLGTGLSVTRDPRFKYYLGLFNLPAVDSSVGTAGFTYQINRKYSISVFEQYDFDFDGGKAVSTSIRVTRKFPRWYAGVAFIFDQTRDDVGLYLTLWPEGIPEFRIATGRLSPLSSSDRN
ncbi:MAG: LPS assembly protein LptD [Phycisphaerae bacterium]|nr:LPS assembly protein LptD [Phycisphaerae bacterium]